MGCESTHVAECNLPLKWETIGVRAVDGLHDVERCIRCTWHVYAFGVSISTHVWYDTCEVVLVICCSITC